MIKFAVMTDGKREVLGSFNSIVLDGRRSFDGLINEAMEYFTSERKFSTYLTGFNIYSGDKWQVELIYSYTTKKGE